MLEGVLTVPVMANYGPRRIQRSKSMIQERSSKDVGMGEKEHRKTDKGVDMMMTVEKVKRRRPHRANTPQSLQPTRAILVPSNQSNALVPIRSTRSHKEEGQVGRLTIIRFMETLKLTFHTSST